MVYSRDQLISILKGALIVSCQALTDEPLHSSFIMSKMALAAKMGGATGIRANTIEDITAIQKEVDLPIIGIIKEEYPDSPVYITPTMKEVDALVAAHAEIIACDATLRPRPQGQSLHEFMKEVRKKYPQQLFMADIATLEEAETAVELGFDFVGTTLHGYTESTCGMDVAHDDFAFLKQIMAIAKVPVIAEGKIDTPEKARRVSNLGVHAIVVGSAITRPQLITRHFFNAIN